MIPPILSQAAVFLILVASSAVLTSRTWRQGIIALAVQYVGVFILVATSWPLGLAAVKLIVGWMSGAVLGASMISGESGADRQGQSGGWLFRLMAAGVVWLLVYSLSPVAQEWIPAQPAVLQGSLLLIGMSLLQLGMNQQPMRVIWGLLTAISGFEVIYAPLETSIMVAGLLVMINLGLALAGAYMITFSGEKADEEEL